MRRRERAYALMLGTICTLSLLGGAWPFPLLAFVLLEATLSTVEFAAARRARLRRGRRAAAARARVDPAGGILRGTP